MKIPTESLTRSLINAGDPASMLREQYAPVYAGLPTAQRLEAVKALRELGLSSTLIAAALDVSTPTAAYLIRRSGALEPYNILGSDGHTRLNPRVGEVNDVAPSRSAGRPITPSTRLFTAEASKVIDRLQAIEQAGGRDSLTTEELDAVSEGVARINLMWERL